MDTPHILLITGEPGVGKTTVMRNAARLLSKKKIQGFLTDELRVEGRRVGFQMVAADHEKAMLAHVDLESAHRVGKYKVDIAALDAMVERTLSLDTAADLYLVDEIGKMECLSERFCTQMRALLDSGRPVVATIALHATSAFVAEVKARDDVVIWQVTRSNRDAMPAKVARWLVSRGV